MLVSHTHRFIYLKTAKTASTSVEIFFERFCRPDPENIDHQAAETLSEIGIVGWRGNGGVPPAQVRFYNHMPAAAVKELLSRDVWRGYLRFCNVRNPFDQVVSLFWMGLPKAQRLSLAAAPDDSLRTLFREWIRGRRLANKGRRAYLIGDELAVDDVIRYEALDEGVARICARIGGEPGPLGAYKTKIRRNRAPFQAYYDAETAARVQAAYDMEFDLFGYDRESWRS